MISVCMTTYNGSKYIVEQLKSIESQTLIPDEVVIIDDCSKDSTVEVIKTYALTSSLNIIIHQNEINVGVIKNFEKALYLAKGDYIFLCDQDDIWLPKKVKLMVGKLKENNTLCISWYELIDQDSKRINKVVKINVDNLSIIKTIVKNSYIGCSIAFHRRLLPHALPLPKNIPMHDSWLGVMASYYYNVAVVEEVTLLYRRHDNNVTGTRNDIIRIVKDRVGIILCFLLRIFKK